MTFVSYAQNFEDVILRRVFADIDHGTYVDVGAWDPVIESVTKAFYDRGWQGINIEPSPIYARLAEARPRDINLNLALGAARGRQMLRVYSAAAEVLQASTLVHEHTPRLASQAALRAADIEVDVMPLSEVLDAHLPGRHIHFLKIDVEGAEESVIRGADWRRHRPEVVLIEATRPQTRERSDGAWQPLMLAAGYQPVLFDGLNAWFLREESSQRVAAFADPPNVFDNFRRHDVEAEQRIAAAEARAQALAARLAVASARPPSLARRLLAASGRVLSRRRRSAAKSPVFAPMVAPEDFVRALYVACLGREPEPEGLAGWAQHLAVPDGAVQVARRILASPEARAHVGAAPLRAPADPGLVKTALHRLGRRPRIVDLGARMLDSEAHIYAALAGLTPLDIIGFDPREERLAERRAAERSDGLTLLPHAIADGGRHVLHVNNDDATSSLLPLNLEHNAAFNHLQTLRTLHTETVQTQRLDDAVPPGPVDLLKLDIQGSEAMALRSGGATLARTAVVHCEVAFAPIYRGQPLFGEIHDILAAQGFDLVDLLHPARYHYPATGGEPTEDRLLWADAVFFRRTTDATARAAQALIAAVVYRKHSLARHLLDHDPA